MEWKTKSDVYILGEKVLQSAGYDDKQRFHFSESSLSLDICRTLALAASPGGIPPFPVFTAHAFLFNGGGVNCGNQ